MPFSILPTDVLAFQYAAPFSGRLCQPTRTISLTQRLLNQLQAMLSKNRDLPRRFGEKMMQRLRVNPAPGDGGRFTFDLADQSKMQLLERFKASNFCK